MKYWTNTSNGRSWSRNVINGYLNSKPIQKFRQLLNTLAKWFKSGPFLLVIDLQKREQLGGPWLQASKLLARHFEDHHRPDCPTSAMLKGWQKDGLWRHKNCKLHFIGKLKRGIPETNIWNLEIWSFSFVNQLCCTYSSPFWCLFLKKTHFIAGSEW